MPNDVTPQPTEPRVRIGARVVVELLRLYAGSPLTDKITLMPQRSRASWSILSDKLQAVQATMLKSSALKSSERCSVAEVLSEHCSDLPISLPIAAPDWGGIELVDTLYDRLAQQLASDDEARAWFSKLQPLVTRYAIQDYSFFFSPQNLLRRFLNQAFLSFLSSTEKSRGVHRAQLNQFSQRLLAGTVVEVGAVNSVCIEAQAWFAGQTEKVEQIEERLKGLEIARRREKVAEPRVVGELNRIMDGHELPADVIHFLQGEWRRSMLMTSMREGEGGADWKRQLRTTESLIELCEACLDPSAREKYKSFYQVLMRNIRSLAEASDDGSEDLEALELVLSAMISGAVPDRQRVKPLPTPAGQVLEAQVKHVSPKALEAIEQLAENDWLRLKTADGQFELCKVVLKGQGEEPWVLVGQSGKTIAKKARSQLASALEGNVIQIVQRTQFWDKELDQELQALHQRWQAQLAEDTEQARLQQVEEAVRIAQQAQEQARKAAAAKQQAELPDLEYEPANTSGPSAEEPDEVESFIAPRAVSEAEMEAACQAIDAMNVGGWINQETTEGEQRCKLAVKIRASEKLVFVNRLGIKVLDTTRQELARLLIHGAVTIVDTGAAFDNTLEQVVRSIQKDNP